jgi:D-alanine-D-alanine ligase
MSRLRVAVIMGGPQESHEASVSSGLAVLNGLDRSRYDAFPVSVERNGEWSVLPEGLLSKADIAFIAAHGHFGESGHLQADLDRFGIPYTGSSAHSTALGMNKAAAYRIFQANGLSVPEHAHVLDRHRMYPASPLGYPVVVKPSDGSFRSGIYPVHAHGSFHSSIKRCFETSRHVIIERLIAGREVSCIVIDEPWGPVALTPMEIYLDADGMKVMSLYGNTGRAVRDIAVKAHQAIGCSGISCTDIILGKDGNIHVLEIGTVPSMAPKSIFAESVRASKMDLSNILDRLILSALRRYDQKIRP